jgi:peptide/nickel transport system ATP-binding protein/oligopeptide transport system ATP-binding protein
MTAGAVAPHLLDVRDLRTWFDSERGVARAVDGVSFHVDAGETLGIVGESGCGKTVTALSLIGLVGKPAGRVVEGSSIRLRGEELVGAGEERMRAVRGGEIAMIFQEPAASLNPVYPVGDQIVEALRAHLGTSRKNARAEAVRRLAEVGIPDPERRVDAYPHQLSGGMSQRVMIAMALACEPALLVADEPTTALDVTVQAQILQLLGELKARHGMALILVTHDLAVVAEVCDRVAVMYAGRIVETGGVEDVFLRPAHPYTRALLDAIPVPGGAEGPLRGIAGNVPSATSWPDGCRFRPRCPLAFAKCVQEPDEIPLAGEERTARCWLASPSGDPRPEDLPR